MANRQNYIFLIISAMLAMGCRKYNELPNLNSPAYLRVFNDIATYPDVTHTGQPSPFLAFLMDPVFDKSGIPENAAVVGDYLATRQLYTVSYPYDAANTTTAAGTTNYEYPGRAHVLTAPPINGFDLSAWAQVPAGRHRLMFVVRPLIDTPFVNLTVNQRNSILIDTTVNLQAGEVYTLEAVLKNADLNTYGPYLRQEDFIQQAFSTDSMYLSFFNLSVPTPATAGDPLSPYYYYFGPMLSGGSNYYYYDYAFKSYSTVPSVTNLSLGINSTFSTTANYFSFPLLGRPYFFDPQNNLGLYDTGDSTTYGGAGPPNYVKGTLPYISLSIGTNSSGFSINFNASPVNFNNLYGAQVFGFQRAQANNSYNSGLQFAASEGLPNLTLVTNVNGVYNIYPTVNILEAVNDRFYLMQIQRGFNQIPKN